MDTLTHSLLGALSVRVLAPNRGKDSFSNRQRMMIGAAAGVFPDVDYVASWMDHMVYLTYWHRTVTHSFVMLPLWSLLVGVAAAFLMRRRSDWRTATLLAGVALVSHILSDVITVYGTQILAPLSAWRASIGTTFIIDPWFTAIVLIGCLAALRSNRERLPQLLLLGVVLLVGFQATMKFRAIGEARAYAAAQGLSVETITAFPQPLSPFNWKILVGDGDHYHVSYVNLAGEYQVAESESGFLARLRRTFAAPGRLEWERHSRFGDNPQISGTIRELWEDPQLDSFRRFAEFPVLYGVESKPDNTCAWFSDLRFVMPYLQSPLRYGLCLKPRVPIWLRDRWREDLRAAR